MAALFPIEALPSVGAFSPIAALPPVAAALSITATASATLCLLCCLLSPATALALGDSNRIECAAATTASPGFRTYLPDCRAYELVTPPYKEGGVLFGEPATISAGGDSLVFSLAGATEGVENDYLDLERSKYVNVFRAERSSQGWRDDALDPAASRYSHGAVMAMGGDSALEDSLWSLQAAPKPLHKETVFLRSADGGFAAVGPADSPAGEAAELPATAELGVVGASQDLSHSLFTIEAESVGAGTDLWPGDATLAGDKSLYEYVYAGTELREPTLVGVRNAGPLVSDTEAQPIGDCGVELGGPGSADTYDAVSSNGGTVFFTVRACGAGGPPVDELYARLDGAETVDISEPAATDCGECDVTSGLHDARFAGASSDGEKVFFTTEQELLPGARGTNLYEYDFAGTPGRRLTLVSRADPEAGTAEADVQGVVRVAETGARIYFVAGGVLAAAADGSLAAGRQVPQAGAENLYVYDTLTGSTAFVATLLDSAEEAKLRSAEETESALVAELAEGSARRALEEALAAGLDFEEALAVYAEVDFDRTELLRGALGPGGTLAVDRSVWGIADGRPAQATPNGDSLLFLSSADLTEGDTSAVPQLFLYDAANETVRRVSVGQGPDAGNVSNFDQAPQIPVQSYSVRAFPSERDFHLAISGDGSRVFFTSAAALTPLAVSRAPNVFEYSEGNVYLISDGRDASYTGIGEPSVRLYGTDPSGRDVFFTTADPLVPQAADSQQALYDAREEGGFPAPAATPGCGEETCRGAAVPAPALPAPASVAPQAEALAAPGAVSIAVVGARKSPSGSARARKLKAALAACLRLHDRVRRRSCRALAQRRYGRRSARGRGARRQQTRTGGRTAGKERIR